MNLPKPTSLSLGAWLALAFTVLSVLLTLLLTVLSDRAASTQVREGIGANLAELANQTTSRLDRSMYERYREVQLIANRLDGELDLSRVSTEINRLQQSYPTYAWIGVTDPAGKVLVATRNMLEGVDVSARPWFGNALQGKPMGDVHEALLLAKLLGGQTGEPLRFVDIAFPLRDDQGQTTGVLGVHLSWQWARDIEQAIFVPVGRSRNVEPLIVSSTGTVLLGPPDVQGSVLRLRSLDAAERGERGNIRETWPDGKDYLVGYSSDRGFDAYPGLGWRVLVRQELGEAYAPVNQLHKRMLLVGLAAAALFSLLGWGVARMITRPLLDLTHVARGIEAGYSVKVPSSRSYAEISMLGKAFTSLVKKLQDNETEVRELNVSLERRVHERTAAVEEALDRAIASEERIQTVIETAQDPFIGMDFEGRITDWNTQAEKLFGWKREEVLGESLAHVIIPERYQTAFVQALAHYLSTGEAPFQGKLLERIVRNRKGREIPAEMKIGLIDTGGVQLFSAFVHDISERKEVQRLKNEFISTVSHELRTPLTSIYVSLSMLESGMAGELPADVQELMKISRQSCERLIRLINDVLDVEKMDSQQFTYDMKRQWLRPLVETAIRDTQSYADSFGVRFHFDVVADGEVMADGDRIVQVVTNLLSNAAKFSPPGGLVQVMLSGNAERMHLGVIDRGPGVPEKFRDRVFDRFAQADGSDRRQKGGTGLGLNICRTIINEHGGEIGFDSEEGVRTEFHFTLPRA
jgi:PAS domain S-box-containing protein